ncbi:SurA N-terminal domain-containing protein [Gemmatimonadota bacterium]
MLSKLREQTKFWMWIVGGAFILTIVFAWGMDYSGGNSNPVLGRVNGHKIMIQQYQAALQESYQAQRQQLGIQELDDAFIEYVQEQTWQQMVDQILINQELNKMGMSATADEIIFVLRNNPPAVMRQIPEFQTDGIFDYQKYDAAMVHPDFLSFWITMEQQLAAWLPQEKLGHLVMSTALVTTAEAEESYRYRNERVAAQFVRIHPDVRPDSTLMVTQDEVQAYYDNHSDEFIEPAKVDMNYLLLYKTASPRDLAEMDGEMAYVQTSLQQGSDFGTLARMYSDDTSANDGGNLGWVNPGDMVSSFDSAAFLLAEGAVSEPILSEYGWHIIKCDSIRDAGTDSEQRSLRHILFKEEASSTTLDSISALLDDVRALAEEEDFTTAAQRFGLTVTSTGPVAQGGFIPGIGFEAKALNFGFANQIGTVSEVFEHLSAYYVLQVRDKFEEGISEFPAVKDMIVQDLVYEKGFAALEPYGHELASRLQAAPEQFASIVEAEGLSADETGTFTRNDYVGGVGRDPYFIAMAFGAPIGEVSDLIQSGDSWFIFKVTEHTEVSTAGLETLIQSEKELLMNQRRQSAYSTWVLGLRLQARITDNRSLYFY